MAVGNVQNTSTLMQSASATSTTSSGSNVMGKDDFMKLLIAQLKNQDPSSPADPKDFVTQLSQLTGVEKMGNMADQLSALQTATSSMVANQATNLVGKHIEADGKTLYLGDNGGASTGYNLAANAKTVTVNVLDASGKVIRSEKLTDTSPGARKYTWDGDNNDGVRMPAGSYTLSVSASDAGNNKVVASTQITGTVTKVSYERGFPELYVGDAAVALANVKTISN